MDGLPGATWKMLKQRILIERTTSRSRSSSWSSSIERRTLFAILVHAIARSWPSSHLKIDQTAWRSCGRTPRSRFDRAAIAARSSRDWGAYMVESPPFEWRAIDERPGPRSWRDRGPIVGLFEAEIKADLDEIEAMIVINGSSPLHDRSWPSIRLHDRVNRPRSSGQFPSLKACISLLCSSTFDRFMKELSEFRGRSLVHRDPPAFRLDCEAIGAGLIANFSLISSNFPLEFRTSTRKNLTKFASIHENWSPILEAIGLVVRFDRLSGGNLSFY